MTEDSKKEIKKNTSAGPVDDDSINNEGASNDHDDEFVSDLHQASSKDIAEADEAMKKLGLTKVQREIKFIINKFHVHQDSTLT